MKIRLKWLLLGATVVALGAGGWHTFQSRKQQKQLIEAQQEAQKNRLAVQLAPGDVVTVQTLQLSQWPPAPQVRRYLRPGPKTRHGRPARVRANPALRQRPQRQHPLPV